MSLDLANVDTAASDARQPSVITSSRSSGRVNSPPTIVNELDSAGQDSAGQAEADSVRTESVSETVQEAAASTEGEASRESSETSRESGAAGGSFAADLIQLTKPRIVMLVLVTTVAAAMVAAEGFFPLRDLVWLLIGTALIAGSAGSANQIWEHEIDSTMARTAIRPIPAGRISARTAIAFTFLIGVLGTTVLATAFSITTALVGLATWGLYVLVYTPLKIRTAWNTSVGAVAGALPILIGYTGLGGSLSDAAGWLLVGVLVTWQYPHFMAIAWMFRYQYAEAGFQMTTTIEPTGRSAAWQSIAGSLALIGCGIALCVSTNQWFSSVIASIAVIAVVYPMLRASIEFARERNDARARRLLRSSLLVLPAVLLIITIRIFW